MTTFGFLSFHEPLWVYVTIPVAAALLGWFTKIVAVKMILYPVEFKGIPPYLGWQGQIPSHAAKMASIAMDSITTTVLKPEELFARIDQDELTRELKGPLHAAAEEIVTATGELLGNFPQAFSHIGLITAASEIDKARKRVS